MKTQTQNILLKIYNSLYNYFGPLNWWPGNTPFEIMVGAILTQNTSWSNVERAINNLKKENLLEPRKLYRINREELAQLIKPSGYYNIKAKRLKNFLNFFVNDFEGSAEKMFSGDREELRKKLLKVNGIGPETADSILLYAGNKPFFVVDAYTKRIFSRHKLISEDASYHQIQEFFSQNLDRDVKLYNEFHAQIVMLGKNICTKRNPKCSVCPLN
ncbi:MAG: endonuclease III domain-containing protein [Candidatus Caldatribacteriota bacterium]|nr:endonuclease III domain-containing protein [Candidatus Caldatribacteriota bacterium]